MTCIVGLIDGNHVFIGGDSAGYSEWKLRLRADEKVFIRTAEDGVVWVFGFTSSFRMGQLIQYDLALPNFEENDRNNLHGFMVKKFVPALRKCLEDGGWRTKKDGQEVGGTLLIGILGELFKIDSDYQVAKHFLPYTAIGSGDDAALGALYASEERPPKERILLALEAAETFNGGVRKPFVVVHT